MPTRPLRHYYGDESLLLVADPTLADVVEPWLRHRKRFAEALESFTDAQWQAPSRCDGWTNRDVVGHLVDVDAFWNFSVTMGRAGQPSEVLRDFDPIDTPRSLVDAMAERSTGEVFASFIANGDALRDTITSLSDHEWGSICESPIGHVEVRVLLAHALWDSWLHERDILTGLDLVPSCELDELAVATWYSLFFGAAQGGLVDDPHPVAEGAASSFTAQVRFDGLEVLSIEVTDRLYLTRADEGTPAGDPTAFVEAFTGRSSPFPPTGGLDPDLVDQLARARQIL
jgi:uncharacterized protein (TIGR03083 family)